MFPDGIKATFKNTVESELKEQKSDLKCDMGQSELCSELFNLFGPSSQLGAAIL